MGLWKWIGVVGLSGGVVSGCVYALASQAIGSGGTPLEPPIMAFNEGRNACVQQSTGGSMNITIDNSGSGFGNVQSTGSSSACVQFVCQDGYTAAALDRRARLPGQGNRGTMACLTDDERAAAAHCVNADGEYRTGCLYDVLGIG